MFAFKLTALLGLMATSSSALYFHLEPLTASDVRIPAERHYVTFTVSNPAAVAEQGGNAHSNCTIAWPGSDVPTCFTPCGSNSGWGYYARVTPGSWNSALDFELDIQYYFVYRNSVLYNAAAIPVQTGSGGYFCTQGGQSTICTFEEWLGGSGLNATFETTYGPVAQQVSPICT